MNIGIFDIGSNTIRMNVYAVGKTGLYGLLVSWKVQAGLVSYIRDGQLPDTGVTRLYFFGSDAKADMYIASDVARWQSAGHFTAIWESYNLRHENNIDFPDCRWVGSRWLSSGRGRSACRESGRHHRSPCSVRQEHARSRRVANCQWRACQDRAGLPVCGTEHVQCQMAQTELADSRGFACLSGR